MNAPERFEMFILPDGVKKVEIIPDPNVQNCSTFDIRMEDHTAGNILRYKLLQNKDVIFSGYSLPHPLEYHVLVRVQTNGNIKPLEAFQEALQGLRGEFFDLRNKFEIEISRMKLMAKQEEAELRSIQNNEASIDQLEDFPQDIQQENAYGNADEYTEEQYQEDYSMAYQNQDQQMEYPQEGYEGMETNEHGSPINSQAGYEGIYADPENQTENYNEEYGGAGEQQEFTQNEYDMVDEAPESTE
ncbi:hypothetical protein BB560_007311 [Smittium megazygosporum]|uniref:DNA-directed RNA polymerase RBP11-like dimerisation domain-containing protein n=1 Tax=Smittium megazygosporum TaxID=133381 RepID=A0A2T9XWX4_9FUNG|nr:hypothetical protein BB560_007311 [Smittium megazygosporum]